APAVAGDADVVVAGSSDDPGHGGAVTVVVCGIRVAVDEVEAWCETPGEVGLRRVDPGVDDRHDRGRVAGRPAPGLGRVGLDRRPLRRPERVVGRAEGM